MNFREPTVDLETPIDPVSVEQEGTLLRIRVGGPLLGQNEAPRVASAAASAISAAEIRPTRVVLDLSSVNAISSLGLGTCLEIRRLAGEIGAETLLLGASHQLIAIFRTMRLDRLYTMVVNESALRRLLAS
jgi:anti-anti-sigma factor